MFCAVKRFKDKEGRWPREKKGRGQARGGVGRWQTSAEGLANVDEPSKRQQKKQWERLIPLREEKLNEIGFPFHVERQATIGRSRQQRCTSWNKKKKGGRRRRERFLIIIIISKKISCRGGVGDGSSSNAA